MSGQWGRKREVSWAVPVVVDDFYPVVQANVTVDPGWMRPKGIRAGRRTNNPARAGALKVGGSVQMEFLTTPAASLLLDMFGAVSGGGPLTFVPGTAGESFTAQTGITDSTGTVRPVTVAGCKLDGWTLKAAVNEFVMLNLDYTARNLTLHRSVADGVTNTDTSLTSATAAFTAADVGRPVSGTGIPAGTTITIVTNATTVVLSAATTATATGVAITIGTALASASYGSGIPWTFIEGSVTAAGSPIASATSFELAAAKNLRNQRHVLGSPLIIEQLEEENFTFMTTIEADFDSNAFNILNLSLGQASLVFTLSDAPSGGTKTLVITQNVQVVGEIPSLTKQGLESQSLKFEASHASADASTITAVLTNGETSAA